MDQAILDLSTFYFVRRFSATTMSVIHHHVLTQEYFDKYDLVITDKMNLMNGSIQYMLTGK